LDEESKDMMNHWTVGSEGKEESKMVMGPFTEMGNPVGASVLVGWNIRSLTWGGVKWEMSIRHPRGDVK